MEWMRENRKIVIGIACGILVLLLGLFIYGFVEVRSNKILRGVHMGEADLSGLTKTQAEEHLEKFTSEKRKDHIRLKTPVTSYDYTYGDLGFKTHPKEAVKEAMEIGRTRDPLSNAVEAAVLLFSKRDLGLTSSYEKEDLDAAVAELAEKIHVKSENATLEEGEEGNVTVTNHKLGSYLDLDEAEELITSLEGTEEVVDLPVYSLEPEITKEDLSFIDGVLGKGETNYSSSEKNRKDNIALGTSYFNEMMLEPGEEVSFLETIGGIDADKGFKESGVIVDGEFDRGIGGGICQVSTTLYNALIYSDVEIVERYNHSRPIGYVKKGMDAAVVDGYKDLKFKNSFKNPIYIIGKANGSDLEFTVYGTKADKPYEVEIIPESLGSIAPKVKTRYSSSMYEGTQKTEKSGAYGYSYQTWRVKKVDGEEVERNVLNKSYYVPKDKIIVVGTRSAPSSDSGNDNNDNDD